MVFGELEIWVWGLILSVGFVLSSYFLEDKEKRGIICEIYDKAYTRRINEIYSTYNQKFLNICKGNDLKYLADCTFKINNVFHISFILCTIYSIYLYQIEKSFIKFSLTLAHNLILINIIFIIVHMIFKFIFKKMTYKINELELNDICETIIESGFKNLTVIITRSRHELERKRLEKEFINVDKSLQAIRKETLIGLKIDYLNDLLMSQKILIHSFTSLIIGIFLAFMYTSIIIFGYNLYINNFILKEPIIVGIGFLFSIIAFDKFIKIVYDLYKNLIAKLQTNIILLVKRKLFLYELLEMNKDNLFTENILINELKFSKDLKYKDIAKLSDDNLALLNLKIKVLDIIKNMEDQYVSRFKFLFYNFK